MSREDAVIRSRSNPWIRRVGAARAGKSIGVLVAEGDRLVDDALARGLVAECVLVASDRPERAAELARLAGDRVRRVEPALLAKSSALETPPGIVALFPIPPALDLEALDADPGALHLVVAGVADPGNLGALARSAEAFGARSLIVLRGGASPWSTKSLRGSMGSLLRLPVAFGVDAGDVARALGRRGVRQVALVTRGGTPIGAFDARGPLALWAASETGELPGVSAGFETLSLPMAGAAESLNVAVAASVALFACGRVDAGEGRVAD